MREAHNLLMNSIPIRKRKQMSKYLEEWKPLIENSKEPMIDFEIMKEKGIERFGIYFEVYLDAIFS